MKLQLLRDRAVLARLALTIPLLGLGACESDHHRDAQGGGAAQADAPTPAMKAVGSFYGGQIEVEVLLNRAGFSPRGDAGGPGGARMGGGGGGGGGRRRGGGGSGGGGSSSDAGGDTTLGGGTDKFDNAGIHYGESTFQPVRLHLRLTNHGATPVVVSVSDFESDLGNFVVQPDKISIAPGQSQEADPMLSRLGVTSDEIPLKVAIDLNGRTETQTLNLKIIAEPPPPPTTQ